MAAVAALQSSGGSTSERRPASAGPLVRLVRLKSPGGGRALEQVTEQRALDEVAAAVREDGVCAVAGLWAGAEVDEMLRAVRGSKPEQMVRRRKRRWDYVYGPDSETFQKIAASKPEVLAIMRGLLGPGARLDKAGVIDAQSGAEAQRWHMDTPHLFSCPQHLPPHAVNCFIATCDLRREGEVSNGPTEFRLGTHRKADLALPWREGSFSVPRGSLVVYDTRLMHRGGENKSDEARTLLYLTYARAWYRDPVNP